MYSINTSTGSPAPLSTGTPQRCAIYQTEAEFTPWNDRVSPQTLRPNFSITSAANGSQCPGSCSNGVCMP